MADSRTTLAVKSIRAGILGKILSLLLSFISRTLFIYILGSECLGINGLFTNILSVLSFAELGFGNAMNFALYKPVAEDNKIVIIQMMDFYKKVYRLIALIVTVLGLSIVPWLQFMVKGAENITHSNLIIYYLLFLTNSVVTYFVSYKFSYVNALQRNYIVTYIETLVTMITAVMQIVIIVIFKSFLAYLLTQTILLVLSRLFIANYLNKKFTILKETPNEKLPKVEKNKILTNVKGLIIHQFSAIAVYSTDNIIISSIISVIVVGYVSNYNLLINAVIAFLTIIFTNLTASMGNVYATETKEVFHNWFKKLNFFNFWLYGFCTVAFIVLIPPFISLWVGADKLIDNISFALIIINTYFVGQSSVFLTARNVVGNFNKDKWWSLLEAIVNLVVSVPLAMQMGLVGVYIGTIVSRLVFIISRPVTLYKLMFNKSSISYYLKFIFNFTIVIITSIITYFITIPLLSKGSWGTFFLAVPIVAIIPNLIFLLFTCWTKDFKNTKSFVVSVLKSKFSSKN